MTMNSYGWFESVYYEVSFKNYIDYTHLDLKIADTRETDNFNACWRKWSNSFGSEVFYLIFYGVQFCSEECGYCQAIPKSCVTHVFLFIAKPADQGWGLMIAYPRSDNTLTQKRQRESYVSVDHTKNIKTCYRYVSNNDISKPVLTKLLFLIVASMNHLLHAYCRYIYLTVEISACFIFIGSMLHTVHKLYQSVSS